MDDQILEAIEHEPELYKWYGNDDTLNTVIASLPPGAEAAAFDILTRIMITKGLNAKLDEKELATGLKGFTAEWASPDEAEYMGMSDDWLLRIYRGEHGVLYDFNGWPGDNEDGAGVYYPLAGEKIDVFVNCDRGLTACEEKLADVVAEYDMVRAGADEQMEHDARVKEAADLAKGVTMEARIRNAMAQEPEFYRWSDTSAIPALPPGAEASALDILVRYVIDYLKPGSDAVELGLGGLTSAWDVGSHKCAGQSSDWRLRIHRGKYGVLYDFNGWPGDNERGGGVFYPAAGKKFDLFSNYDCLEAIDETYRQLVEDYDENARRADGCLDEDDENGGE